MRDETIRYIIARVVDNVNSIDPSENNDFINGKKLAYYEVLDTIKNELIANGVDLREFGLDINLEEFLL